MKQNRNYSKQIIGITGGIASGKSTVSKLLREKGYPVIDADEISRKVVRIGESAYNKIVEQFGREILNADLTINRSKLADIIFSDSSKRLKLNKIVHFEVINEIKKQIEFYSRKNNVIFLDIPLLIEEMDKLREGNIVFNQIWLIYVDEDTQVKRLMNRDKLNINDAYKRIRAQMPITEKLKYADVIIDNSEDKSYLEKEIDMALKRLNLEG